MSKKLWLGLITTLAVIGFLATKSYFNKTVKKEKFSVANIEGKTYWTCPMHPQIHSEVPGECPICHMKLVQVKAAQAQEAKTQSRATIQVSSNQIELLGVQKQQVEKMDLVASIPISGRIISSSMVAFQVYESDLKNIKAGLSFKGESSFYPESPISGTISSVDSIVDPTSRTVRVVGVIRKGPRGLISETTFRGNIELNLRGRIGISESSVLHTGDGDLVYLFKEGNKLEAKSVKLGIKTNGFYEVLEGLSPGDFISSGPNFLIDSEAKIRGTND